MIAKYPSMESQGHLHDGAILAMCILFKEKKCDRKTFFL